MMYGEGIMTVTNWTKQFLLLCLLFQSLLMLLASVHIKWDILYRKEDLCCQ
jgi:hypothetical protein